MERNTLQHRARVAAYCRVAADGGEQDQTLAAQKAYYTQKIERNPDWEMAGIFTDLGISSADMKNRKGFNRMISACKRGRVDMILTKSLSRFARNTLDCLKMVRELKKLGVGVVFEKENVNTLAPADSDELRTALFNSLARAESEEMERRFGRHICIMYMARRTG